MAVDDRTEVRNDGPTPSGGSYSIARYYRIRSGKKVRCRKIDASHVEIVEYDRDDSELKRTFSRIGNPPEPAP